MGSNTRRLAKAPAPDRNENEVTEMWRDIHSAGQEKRSKNRVNSTDLLMQKGIRFDARNGGAHIIIREEDTFRVDFWPGTGLFIAHLPFRYENRGVFNLVKFLERNKYQFSPLPTKE